MIKSAIDIGSNSVLLLTVEVNKNQIINEIHNESAICSLGRDLDKNKKFHPNSMNAAFKALFHYREILRKISFPPEQVVVTATEASRVAINALDFFSKVKTHLGFNVQIITSQAEAYYTAKGVASSLESSLALSKNPQSENAVIMDIGGASTELIKIKLSPFEVISSISLPFGSVRAFNWNEDGALELQTKNILANFSKLHEYETDTLICVAGSMTAIAAIYLKLPCYQDQKIDGMEISFSDFNSFANSLKKKTVKELIDAFPYLEKRAPYLYPGSFLAQTICQKLKVKKLKISTRGLRYGVVLSGQLSPQDLY